MLCGYRVDVRNRWESVAGCGSASTGLAPRCKTFATRGAAARYAIRLIEDTAVAAGLRLEWSARAEWDAWSRTTPARESQSAPHPTQNVVPTLQPNCLKTLTRLYLTAEVVLAERDLAAARRAQPGLIGELGDREYYQC